MGIAVPKITSSLDVVSVALLSTRVFLHRPGDMHSIVARTSLNGNRLVIPGGKMSHTPIETLGDGVAREIREETGWQLSDFELFAALPAHRVIELDKGEAKDLGLPVTIGSRKRAYGLILCEVLFTAEIDAPLPKRPVEGRRLLEVDLSRPLVKPFKARHARAVELYLQHVRTGRPKLTSRERDLTNTFYSVLGA